jgi:prepilin-type processing-associated H-X9-DG protein
VKLSHLSLALIGLLCACGAAVKSNNTAIAANALSSSACRSVIFENSEFSDCIADPQNHDIRLYLNSKDGLPYRSLDALKSALGNKSADVIFAMNAGMYNNAGKPIGYYVENKERIKTLNRKKGGGNFHLLPNGVFSVEADGWHIRTSDDFAENVMERPQYATQSGPMLLIDGKLHPDVSENGVSVNIRNAVCINKQGRAHFVISQGAVSFGRLARMMRDTLKCANALYLDGSVSALWYPAGGRMDGSAQLGPLIAVMKTAKETK